MLALAMGAAGPTSAQEPVPFDRREVFLDSGFVEGRTADSGPSDSSSSDAEVVFSQELSAPGAEWLRLYFHQAILGTNHRGRAIGGRAIGGRARLRITSLADGAVQTLDAETLRHWRYSSAYFNGDTVRVELLAHPGSAPSRVRIQELDAGLPLIDGWAKSICGSLDDRTLSDDERIARVMPEGCTAWLIDDAHGCFLSAGHCHGAGFDVVQFNVPLSEEDGTVTHPGPEHQYPVDPASIQFSDQGIGNDFLYFGAFPNGQTQLTPLEAQGRAFALGTPPISASDQALKVTGYGRVDGSQGTPQSWNQAQHSHDGPLTSVLPDSLQYRVDTTGGDSGAPVIDSFSGQAIGIHSHAGCTEEGGANHGTSIVQPALWSALSQPMGICAGGAPELRVELASSLPVLIQPTGLELSIQTLDRQGQPAAATAATLLYDQGEGEIPVAMIPVAMIPDGQPAADHRTSNDTAGGTTFVGSLPALACGREVTFRFEVQTANGAVVRHPFSADNHAGRVYRRPVALSLDETFRDDFEIDLGWTVNDDPSLQSGTWERGRPAGYGLEGDPPWDADSSGRAFLTYNSGGNTDVDDGATRLTSPTLDAAGPDPHLHYWRWWDDQGSSDDVLLVELSNDDGRSWIPLESVGPGLFGQWIQQSFRIADVLTPTDQLKVRFTAADLGEGHLIEAGVDGVRISNGPTGFYCGELFSDGFESGDARAWSSAVPQLDRSIAQGSDALSPSSAGRASSAFKASFASRVFR